MITRNNVYQKQAVLLLRKDAVKHNVTTIRSHTSATIIAVIKDNGYGTGLYNEYSILRECGVDFFAVINAEEARQLRSFGFTGSILVLAPVWALPDACDLLAMDAIFMLGSSEQASLLREAGAKLHRTPRVHLKIDTGLGRYGFHYRHIEKIASCLNSLSVEGCYTHFAALAPKPKKQLALQKERFDNALLSLRLLGIDPGMTHMAASTAFLLGGDLGYDAIRPGSLLLGRSAVGTALPLDDAIAFQTHITQTRLYPAGSTLGYRAKRLRRDTRVGLLPVGTGDGVFLSSELSPWPVLGSGTDFTLLDLTDTLLAAGDSISLRVNPLFIHPAAAKRLI